MSNQHGTLTPARRHGSSDHVSIKSSTRSPAVLSSSSSAGGGLLLPPPALLCNRCSTPLATTCFLCACDCVFCEGKKNNGSNVLVAVAGASNTANVR